jgi:lipoate-protein ligase B
MIEKVKIKLKVYNLVSPGVFYDYKLLWRYQKSLAELSSNLYKINQNKLLSTNHTTSSNDHDIVSTEHTDYLILVQHKSIYTLGRGGTTDNFRFKSHERSKHEVVRVERGNKQPVS